MSDEQKPKGRTGLPVGYIVTPVRKRVTRPVHASRKAILEQAVAAFKPKPNAESGNLESKK